jgi:predicted permease
MNSPVHAQGREPVPGEDLTTYFNMVTPGYFSTVGLSIVAGRDFGPQDRPESGKVVVINEAAAKYWFPVEDPIGKRIGLGATGATDMVIIGVVKNAKYLSVREKTLRTVYRLFSQAQSSPMTLHVRTTGNAGAIVPYVRRAVQKVDGQVPLFNLLTIESRVDESLKQERLLSTLASMLGFLGTVLAGIGLYGLISYSVVQRTKEIGARMALGATPRQVAGAFVRKALVITLGGIAIGVPLSLVTARVFSGFLYGLSPADSSTIVAATTLLLVIAALAALLPALRAARVDPLRALRQE